MLPNSLLELLDEVAPNTNSKRGRLAGAFVKFPYIENNFEDISVSDIGNPQMECGETIAYNASFRLQLSFTFSGTTPETKSENQRKGNVHNHLRKQRTPDAVEQNTNTK